MSRLPILGISCGDINGVGTEILIKSINTLLDLEIVIVFFGSIKLWSFYSKNNKNASRYNLVSNISELKKNKINIFNCLNDDLEINPGKMTLFLVLPRFHL